MLDLLKKTAVAAAVAFAMVPVAASATVVQIFDGDTTNPIVIGDTYFFEDQLSGTTGATSRSFTFVANAADAPLPVVASSLTLTGFRDSLINPFMSWSDGINTVFAPVIDLGTGFKLDLATLFTNPDRLSQVLTIGWESFSGQSTQVSLQVNAVSAVPLPAGGLLLIGALGGLAALRRRKNAA